MLYALRTLLMWLVALAIPLQGFAAASGCGPGHHGAVDAQVHAAPMQERAFGMSAHEANPAGDATSHRHAASAAPMHGDAAQAAEKTGAGSCSACASCCLAAALPAATLSFEAGSVAGFIAPLIPGSATSFFTDGPERPPRSIRA